MNIAALILAGGQGTRLGGVDKAFLSLAGQPLITHVLARLGPHVPGIAISANGDPARFAAFGRPVLPDPPAFLGQGPLAGVAAGLIWARSMGAQALLTLPVDTPFFPSDLAARLHPAPAVAAYAGRQHHLVALWEVAFAPALADFLRGPGPYRVRVALDLAGARHVEMSDPADPFLNINSLADLDKADIRASDSA